MTRLSTLDRVKWVALILGAAAFALVPLALPTYQVSIATEIVIFAVLAMAIDLLAGFTGRTPLCHGAVFGVATYVVLYCVTVMGTSPWLAVVIAIIAATLLAALFGLLAIRTSGVYFLLLTLALGMLVWGVCLRWTSITGGENGLRGSVRPDWLNQNIVFYYAVLVVVAVATIAMWRLVNSPFGTALRGIKDSETRMRSLGYNVPLHLFLIFTISGFFAGIAGALYALFNNFVSPSTVALSQSVEGLLMAIVGGIGTLFGAFIGAFAIVGLENVVSIYTERWQTVMGCMFILIMIFAPEGVIGRLRMLIVRVLRR
ncbi:MAG TPA: branched-chain amino acid ABC transporter permease [Pseudolabrys sp.]|jgi:branched-chain amino acid transport system permease protein|nr:branched-chain amino acid ABC transporter permease [Pseudolabrys sp.]